jgi:uncharacterized protein (TIGR00299 family) protein
MRHLHLDAIGGIAGDMFVAALLDAEPAHTGACLLAAESVAGVPCRVSRHRDAALSGARFHVATHEQQHDHPHAHTTWADIRARLQMAALPPSARQHALGIFSLLAETEARVHGVAVDAVTFHEVGAVDSIADIVAAGWLIATQEDVDGVATWSVGPLPLGGGRIRTAHGVLPVPAPATVLLLEGFLTMDDGISGERVTPTGAAILRYLHAQAAPPTWERRVLASGIGFGTRTLPGMSNVLRVVVSATATPGMPADQTFRELAVIEFEVDDQTPEDLAVGLDHVRHVPGVRDVLQMPALGKKGRACLHIQVLAEPTAAEAAIAACFSETTTIGLRTRISPARALRREITDVAGLRVKRTARQSRITTKAEIDDLAGIEGHAERQRARARAERPEDE